MSGPKISKCANPNCDAEFRRLCEGKLFAHHPRSTDKGHKRQIMAWLCSNCYQTHTMEFDEIHQVFQIQSRRRAA